MFNFMAAFSIPLSVVLLLDNVMPVPILAASDLIQALTLMIASFGFYSDLSHLIEATGGE